MNNVHWVLLSVGFLVVVAAIVIGVANCNQYAWQRYESCMASGTPYTVCTDPRMRGAW
jgi:hypothetical protein